MAAWPLRHTINTNIIILTICINTTMSKQRWCIDPQYSCQCISNNNILPITLNNNNKLPDL